MTNFHKICLFSAIFLFIFGFCLSIWQIQPVAAQTKPLTYPEIITALTSKLPNSVFKNKTQLINWLIAQIKQRKVDKPLSADREELLIEAGATNEIIEAIKENSPRPATPTPISTPSEIPTPIPTPTPTPTPVIKPSPTPTPLTLATPPPILTRSTTFKNSLGMEFISIPGGSFMMGNEKGNSDEKPVRSVIILNSIWMGKTEVTQGQWKAIMGSNPSKFKNCGDNCPVENISWNDIQDFIKKLNAQAEGIYRLPTEAEWEYACRAGSTTKYSYGENESSLDNYVWYSSNSDGKPHEVATKQPNAWGIYDMNGNIWEWTQDLYGTYSGAGVTDPKGASSGLLRVIRGSGWDGSASNLYSAYRGNSLPSSRGNYLGFRLVKE